MNASPRRPFGRLAHLATLTLLAAACSSAASDPASNDPTVRSSSAKKRDAGVGTNEGDDETTPSRDAGRADAKTTAKDGGEGDVPDDQVPDDGLPDAAAPVDASTRPDATTPHDAAVPVDAAPAVDTGPPCTLHTYYEDLDVDGYGSAVSVTACVAPAGYVALRGDCDDENPLVHPNETVYYETPYTLPNGKLSFDYDCSGAEDAPANPSPLCSDTHCSDRHTDPGNTCVRPGSTTNRALASPNPTCGEPLLTCYSTSSGAPMWMANGNTRRCR